MYVLIYCEVVQIYVGMINCSHCYNCKSVIVLLQIYGAINAFEFEVTLFLWAFLVKEIDRRRGSNVEWSTVLSFSLGPICLLENLRVLVLE